MGIVSGGGTAVAEGGAGAGWADRRMRPAWSDLVPAVPLLAVAIGGSRASVLEVALGDRAPDLLAVVLAATAALLLLLRRAAPRTGFVLCGAVTTVYLLAGYPFGPVLLAPPVAAYAVGRVLPPRALSAWAGALLLVTSLAVLPRSPLGAGPSSGWLDLGLWFARWSLLIAAGAVLGAAVTVRRRAEAEVRAEKALRGVSEERLAIAREVHDGVGHGLAVIALNAGVALHLFDRDPQRAQELLRTIQATSRDALDDLRQELDRFRSPGPGAAAGADCLTTHRPRPGLADVPVLLERMRVAGLDLRTDLGGIVGGIVGGIGSTSLPEEVDAAAYRIVQESLTNVLRHSDSPTAAVGVTWDRTGALVVEVTDEGRGGDGGGDVEEGSGILGMRRRAEAIGGSLTAGPRSGRGFAVRAVLPLPAESPTS